MISSSARRPPARSPVWILKRTYCIRRGERGGEASAAALKNDSACFKSPCAQASVASAALTIGDLASKACAFLKAVPAAARSRSRNARLPRATSITARSPVRAIVCNRCRADSISFGWLAVSDLGSGGGQIAVAQRQVTEGHLDHSAVTGARHRLQPLPGRLNFLRLVGRFRQQQRRSEEHTSELQ